MLFLLFLPFPSSFLCYSSTSFYARRKHVSCLNKQFSSTKAFSIHDVEVDAGEEELERGKDVIIQETAHLKERFEQNNQDVKQRIRQEVLAKK